MEKFSNAIFFRQIALQNLQRKNLGFSETGFGFERGLDGLKDSQDSHFGSGPSDLQLALDAL